MRGSLGEREMTDTSKSLQEEEKALKKRPCFILRGVFSKRAFSLHPSLRDKVITGFGTQ